MTSGMEFYVISSASTVALPGSIITIVESVKQLEEYRGSFKKLVGIDAIILFTVRLGSIFYTRWENIFWDDGNTIEYQTAYLEDNPGKIIAEV